MIIFAYTQTIKQTDTNLITEAHSNPLWIVGERANSERSVFNDYIILGLYVFFLDIQKRGTEEQRSIVIRRWEWIAQEDIEGGYSVFCYWFFIYNVVCSWFHKETASIINSIWIFVKPVLVKLKKTKK